jgi:uncharacterized protein YxjI
MLQKLLGEIQGGPKMVLPPQPQPFVVTEPRFIVHQQTTLKLSEEVMSFSGDDFTVVDPHTNLLWFKIDGKVFSFKDKKVMTDNMGVPICNMQAKIFSFTRSQELYKGKDGPKICGVNAKFTFMKAKITANVTNAHNGQQVLVCVKGNWLEKNAIISIGDMKQGGVPIAQVSRSLDLKELFFSKQTYYVTIAPGVDAAFIAMLCVAIDEVCRDNK